MSLATATGNTTRLWTLVAKEMWRKARRRLRAGPIYRWRYSGRTPERVLIAPPDLRLADPQIALEIYYGRFPLSGHMVETGGLTPFQLDVVHRPWVKGLHSFRWLRHMRAAGTDLAAANARALVSDWIQTHGNRISGVAWDPAVTARRIIAWLQHSSVVLQGAEFPFYRAFLQSLAVQIRFLRSMASERSLVGASTVGNGAPRGQASSRPRWVNAWAICDGVAACTSSSARAPSISARRRARSASRRDASAIV